MTGCAPLTHVIPTASDFDVLYDIGITAAGGYLGVQAGMGNEPLEACSEAGCSTFVNISGGDDLNTWAVSGSYVGYSINGSRSHFIYAAQVTNGASTTLWMSGSDDGTAAQALNPFALDGTDFVYQSLELDAGAALMACKFADDCAAPAYVTPSVPDLVNVYGGTIYLVHVGAKGVASIATCPVTGCVATGPTPFVGLQAGAVIIQTAIDSSGIYWLDNVGNISMCPLAGCNQAGISVTTTGSDLAAAMFAVADGFVYFVGTGTNNTTVYRIAVPGVP